MLLLFLLPAPLLALLVLLAWCGTTVLLVLIGHRLLVLLHIE